MKEGTKYASKLKTAFNKLKKSSADSFVVQHEDPLYQLGLAVLSADADTKQAQQALERCLARMVDWNEIRVSTPEEVAGACSLRGAQGEERAHRLITVLQSVYDAENEMSLDRLKQLPRRETRQLLESMHGMRPYEVASVILWSLGGHAIPVDDSMLKTLRDAELVHQEANLEDVQAFLERNISAADARDFVRMAEHLNGVGRGKSAAKSKRTTKTKSKKTTKTKASKKKTKRTAKKKTAS